MASAQVTAADRLGFTLFMALAVHGLVLFGVGFAPEQPRAAPRTLDVTLATHRSDQAPDEADFIAQTNQEGAGDEQQKQELTTTEQAPYTDARPRPVRLEPASAPPPRPVSRQKVIVTHSSAPRAQSPQQEQEQEPREQRQDDSLDQLSREIASLQARLDQQQQAYAKRPRVRRLTSVSTKAHYEALYIDAFRRKVESTGTRHFPARALTSNTFGGVRLMVALGKSGDIRDIRVLQSSGHAFLDEAAVQSVRLSAPFEPFSPEMRQNMDVLEIIRTWQFDANRQVSSR
ncbi:TonB [Alcanivorax xiamenensis]|uniref:TonB n=1 Tax=Alcanivorax xiamenensis TaxID=1177156 RepID=A0ABQ6YDM9_9GAMM|nr:TonB family protein [Alcanivorax xiamenensis]KAF0808375.1 TonB [Alcanivorax xiamenensis]